jgi:hypothetical protein
VSCNVDVTFAGSLRLEWPALRVTSVGFLDEWLVVLTHWHVWRNMLPHMLNRMMLSHVLDSAYQYFKVAAA